MTTETLAARRIEPSLDLLHAPSRWIEMHGPDLLLALVLGLTIFAVLEAGRWLSITLASRLVKRGALFAILKGVLQKTSHVFLALAAAKLVAGYTDPSPHVLKTVTFLFTVAAVVQAARWLRAAIFGIIDRQTDPAHGGNEALANASALIRTLVNAALFIIALVVILDNLGVNVTGLVAGLGIGGIAIGLAAQGIFSDLFASLSIIFDRPFRVGETIDFGKGPAVVERIGLKSTRLRAVTGERLIVSNAQLLGKEITSFAGLERRRFSFALGLVYQTPPELADQVPAITRAVVESEGGEFIRSGFIGFGASSLDFDLQFDVAAEDLETVHGTRHRIGLALLRRFSELGLSFAYPTQTTFTADPDGRLVKPYPDVSRS